MRSNAAGRYVFSIFGFGGNVCLPFDFKDCFLGFFAADKDYIIQCIFKFFCFWINNPPLLNHRNNPREHKLKGEYYMVMMIIKNTIQSEKITVLLEYYHFILFIFFDFSLFHFCSFDLSFAAHAGTPVCVLLTCANAL